MPCSSSSRLGGRARVRARVRVRVRVGPVGPRTILTPALALALLLALALTLTPNPTQGGWPASRTILTYQSFDAARVFAAEGNKHTLLPFLGRLLGNFSVQTRVYGETFTLQGPYAGVLGWPAQCAEGDRRCWPDADKANMQEVMKGAKESGVHFKVPNGQGHF